MDLWFMVAVAALAGVACLLFVARQRRWRWLTAAIGSILLLIAAAILFLTLASN